ncbi:hypothetical protein BGZ79_005454 [Entomortierella chlamydospora]|nr:hypothetical protein BGZ79_005454 [Entomortierella chlamydospora]
MSVAILHKGKLIFAEGFGKRNDRDPFTPETLTMIGSLTKAFTAATVGELVAEGKVDWDTTPVNKYLPEFELQDPGFTAKLTLADLLSHRTGFPPLDFAWFYNTESPDVLIKRMKYVDIDSKMSPYTQYNNVMFAIAGYAAANAVGVKYQDLVRDKIFKPLGLENTGFSSKEMSKHSNYALPYTATSYENAVDGKHERLHLTNLATAVAPSGDMYSNVLDLVRWGQTIMHYGKKDGKQVLNKDSITEILSAQSIYEKRSRSPDFGPLTAYGLGWTMNSYKGNNVYCHDGSTDGYNSNLALFPDEELVIAQLTNAYTDFTPGTLSYSIADEILGLPKTEDWMQKAINMTQAMYKKMGMANKELSPPRVMDKPASHKLSEFAGVYTNPIYGNLSIVLKKDGKGEDELNLEFRVYEGKLTHYHYDSFSTTFCHSAISVTDLVTFRTGQDGKVSGVQIRLDSWAEFEKQQ